MSNRIAPKLFAEFIGTFSFVFLGASTAAEVGEGVGLPGIAAIAFASARTATTMQKTVLPGKGQNE